MNWSSIRALCRKDLLDLSRNGVVLFIVMIPLSLSLIYGRFLPSGGLIAPEVLIVGGEASDFRAFASEQGTLAILEAEVNWEDAREQVRNGVVCGAIRIPDSFTRDGDIAEPPRIEIIVDASRRMGAAVLQQGMPDLFRAYFGQEPPVEIETQVVRAERARYTSASIWITLAIILAGLNMVPTLLVEERDRKTLNAILVTMTTRREIVVGKVLVGMLMSISMVSVILAVNLCFTGNLFTLVAVVLLATVSFVMLGLFIGSVSRNGRMASLISSLLLLPLMLGATMSDVSSSVSAVSRFLPSYYVRDGLEQAIVLGSPLTDLWSHCLFLGSIGAVSFAGAIWFLRKNYA